MGDFNYFFNDVVNIFYDFHWHMDNLFNFLNLDHFHQFLDYFLDWHYLRNFNYSIHNLLDNFFHLYDLGDNSEDLENVINFNHTHDLFSDHSNNSLIDFQDYSSSASNLFKFFQKCFDKDSKMELYSSRFVAAVGINVLNAMELRYVLDYGNHSFKVI